MTLHTDRTRAAKAAMEMAVEGYREFATALAQLTHLAGAAPKVVPVGDSLELRWEQNTQAWDLLLDMGGSVSGHEVVVSLWEMKATAIATRRETKPREGQFQSAHFPWSEPAPPAAAGQARASQLPSPVKGRTYQFTHVDEPAPRRAPGPELAGPPVAVADGLGMFGTLFGHAGWF